MKILHISGGDLNYGAARGVYWLHQGLLNLGLNSKLLIQKAYTQDPTVVSASITKQQKLSMLIKPQIDQLPLAFYKARTKYIFSPGFIGADIRKCDEYKAADIIHMHWINNAFINIKLFSKINKPIVWTFRDMWPFTGGCHYTRGCDRYRRRCGRCPHLKSSLHWDLSRLIYNRKSAYFKNNIYPVAISHWLEKCAKKSPLFRNKDVRIIHNCIDTNLFHPIPTATARKILNIPQNKNVILFGALHSIEDKRKGAQYFFEALRNLSAKKKYYYAIFGSDFSSNLFNIGIDGAFLGHLKDNISLVLAYSAADVFVAPSLQEGFGKTLIESMACGTSVVAFNTGGPKDIISHKQDGYLARPFEAEDLAQGIEWILKNKRRWHVLANNGREKVQCEFSLEIIAKQYAALYKQILEKS